MNKPVDKSKRLRDELDTIFSQFFFRASSTILYYNIIFIYNNNIYLLSHSYYVRHTVDLK